MDKKIFALLHCICLCRYAVVSGLQSTDSQPAITLKNCGRSILPPSSPDRIVGGNIVPHGQYPWIVSLQENTGYGGPASGFAHACGATILNENWTITAAHCIDYFNEPWRYQIFVGLHQLSKANAPTVQRIKISKLVLHKEFNEKTGANDIALLKTDEPIDIAGSKGYANGICFPNTEKDPKGYATVAGWGHTSEGGVKSDTLREVVLPIVSRDICKLSYEDYPTVMDTMICAGGTEKDACQDDSGGPLFQTNSEGVSTLIGIVSFGKGCGIKNVPGVYTKVSSYQSWIENAMTTY